MPATKPNQAIGARTRRLLTGLACVFILWTIAGTAYATPVFKCVDAQGHVAFRDSPCPPRMHQTRIALHPLPTIGDADEVAAERARASAPRHVRTAGHPRRHRSPRRRAKPKMSWECRAADGEVFYRHTRCPSSVRGDGVVRVDYAARMSREYPHRRHNAWSRVRVHGSRIPRAEACRRIRSPGAAGRDGHLRDAHVSTYARLTGRDPCAG